MECATRMYLLEFYYFFKYMKCYESSYSLNDSELNLFTDSKNTPNIKSISKVVFDFPIYFQECYIPGGCPKFRIKFEYH